MLLTSGSYFLFLIVVFFCYWSIAERQSWRPAFLALAGYFFYAQAGALPVALLFAISSIDYLITRLMSSGKPYRKLLLATSLVIDIGTLCGFKYANFFIDSATG